MPEIKYITVTALTKYIKRKFTVDPHLQNVWIKGELSNFKTHSRGHMYFTVKDEKAKIQGVMFAGDNRSLKFSPENGMKVLLRGEISVYEPSGNYQIYVREMQPDGIGNLYLAYEELKKRLEVEGLFSSVHKKEIPNFPQYIGVITSPTGAAIRDILTTIKRRYPIANVILIPALVQGPNAVPSIVKAIQKANSLGYLETLIVGRGGGSIEELWAFNEEAVAREIFLSTIPIISAVGHETDFTIADFVADMRAPTPTGAAELVVPHMVEIQERLSQRKTRLLRVMKEIVSSESERLKNIQNSYAFRYPKNLYDQKQQQFDRVIDRFEKEGQRTVERKNDKLNHLFLRLQRNNPAEQLTKAKERHNQQIRSLQKVMTSQLKEKRLLFHSTISKLQALSPLKIMERGYSLVYNKDENLVKSVRDTQPGESVKVQLQDGQLDCKVWGIEERTINE
mgnify:CR=1 FL=1